LLLALLLRSATVLRLIITCTVIPKALIQTSGIDVFQRIVQRILIKIQTLRITEISKIEN